MILSRLKRTNTIIAIKTSQKIIFQKRSFLSLINTQYRSNSDDEKYYKKKMNFLKQLRNKPIGDQLRLNKVPVNEDPNIVKGRDLKNFQSSIYNSDKFWGDQFDDDYDSFEKQEKTSQGSKERYKTLHLEDLGGDNKPANKDIERKFPKPIQIPRLSLMRIVHKMHREKPTLWTVNKLSAFFGLPSEQTKRYIINVDVEEQIKRDFKKCNDAEKESEKAKAEEEKAIEAKKPKEKDAKEPKTKEWRRMSAEEKFLKKRFPKPKDKKEKDVLENHLNEKLYEMARAKFMPEDTQYEPIRTYVLETFNKRTGNFAFKQKLRLFGSTDDETLKYDLGSPVPRLAKREVPKKGPGSGKPINAQKIKRMEAPLMITDITRKRHFKPYSMDIPIKVREKDGSMRHATILEYIKIRRKERPDMRCKKFSPH